MDTQEKTQTAPDANAEIPGMKEARERMDQKFWKDREEKRTLMQEVADELAQNIKMGVLPTLQGLTKIVVTIENPLTLVTAIPLVQSLRINRALAEIATVPEGKTLIDALGDTKIRLDPDPRYNGGRNTFFPSYRDGEMKLKTFEITAQGYATQGEVIAILLHEMHHERQIKNGVMKILGEKVPSPVEQVWYERAMEADAQATATDIAWKLKEAGKPGAWRAMAADMNCMGDIAKAYADKVAADPDAVASGTAKRAAFDKWFTAKNLVGDNLSVIYNGQGINNLPKGEDLDKLYKAGKPFAPLAADDIAKLGTIAEKNYLALPGGKPLDSMDYRQADWNAWQAGHLNYLHKQYDDVKTGNFVPPAMCHHNISKFISPEKPAAPAPEAKPAPTASVHRPKAPKV